MAVSVSTNVSMNISPHSVPAARGCKYTGQSVRAVPIRILTVGKNRSVGVQLIVDEYIGKLKNYCSIDDVQIRSNPKNARDVMAQIEQEDAAVMKIVKPGDWSFLFNLLGVEKYAYCGHSFQCASATPSDRNSDTFRYSLQIQQVVMLDENGLGVRSEQMAELIGDAGNTGASNLLFCIGGPYGHGKQLRERANMTIKLSSLVLNHQIALVVLMEQLYRAWTILKGQKYHH